jgi:hypothetical protein
MADVIASSFLTLVFMAHTSEAAHMAAVRLFLTAAGQLVWRCLGKAPDCRTLSWKAVFSSSQAAVNSEDRHC